MTLAPLPPCPFRSAVTDWVREPPGPGGLICVTALNSCTCCTTRNMRSRKRWGDPNTTNKAAHAAAESRNLHLRHLALRPPSLALVCISPPYHNIDAMVTILMSDGSERAVPPSPDGVLNVEGDLVNWINSHLFPGLPRQFSLGERLLGGDRPLPAVFQSWTLQSIKSTHFRVSFYNDGAHFDLAVQGEPTQEAFLQVLHKQMNVPSRLVESVTQLDYAMPVLVRGHSVVVRLKPEKPFVLIDLGKGRGFVRAHAGTFGLPIPGTYSTAEILRALSTLGMYDDVREHSLYVDGRSTRGEYAHLRSGTQVLPVPVVEPLAAGQKRAVMRSA